MTKAHPIAALLLVLSGLIAGVHGATALERGMFGWRSAEISGTRPLLVIWLREPDSLAPDELGKYRSYYQDVVFGRSGTGPSGAPRGHFERSVANYYREVSGGKFAWSKAGMVGPLSAQIKGKPASEIARLAIEAAAIESGFDFRPFDTNRDGRIAAGELAVLVIVNTPVSGRHWEDFPPDRSIVIPGQGVAFASRAAVIGENDGFATIARQVFRLLVPEAIDLDGSPQRCFALNTGRSLMAASNSANPALTMHLDPWHKMMAGWVEPRIVPFGQSGKALLAAQHLSASEAESKRPILLFDPQRGPREFFLLEYRTHSELGFDQAVVNSGLVIWQVAFDGANRPFAVPADRPNCKGEVLSVPSLFVRGGPNWQLGGNRAYASGDGPVSLRWLDGKDSGVWVTTTANNPVEWRIEVAWTAPDPRGTPSIQLIPAATSAKRD
jgi:hypothetical protein